MHFNGYNELIPERTNYGIGNSSEGWLSDLKPDA